MDKTSVEDLADLREIFEKGLAVNRVVRRDDVLRLEDLESKKPSGLGIPAKQSDDLPEGLSGVHGYYSGAF